MKRLLSATALALAFGLGPVAAHQGQEMGSPAGMMGGSCPMMGMGSQSQMGQGQGQGMMMGQGQMDQGMMGQREMGAMVEARLAYLKAQLDIADDQQSAWQGYADAVRGRVETMQARGHRMFDAMQSGTAVERMTARVDMMEAMVEAMKAMLPATEQLYAVLDDDQKQVADRLIGMHCGAM